MSTDFTVAHCQTTSKKKMFGLCDNPPPAKDPAYIDENNGANWIAVVLNDESKDIIFTAIDNCIEIKRVNGDDSQRCDGVLTFEDTVIFVELKDRFSKGKTWITDAEGQLRETISFFEKEDLAEDYQVKKAYIANKALPKFRNSQAARMEKFFDETGYILRIENRIQL
jgi:hypothetical protein